MDQININMISLMPIGYFIKVINRIRTIEESGEPRYFFYYSIKGWGKRDNNFFIREITIIGIMRHFLGINNLSILLDSKNLLFCFRNYQIYFKK
jgi:hypothetical protein